MTLTRRQQRAIEALMVSPSIEAAAERAGVHRATLHRWLADATFCDSLRRFESEAWAATVRRLSHLSGSAVGVLCDALKGSDVSARQLRAAELALSHGTKLREMHALEERISALEANYERRNKSRASRNFASPGR
jgi:hypothetical protein